MPNFKPKILILITKAEIGGAQNFVLNLADGLKKAGFQITVGCGQKGFLTNQLTKQNISLAYFANLKRSHNPLAALFFAQELKKYLNQHYFDALILNSSNTLPAAYIAKQTKNKPKTIFVFHGLSLLDKNYRAPFILKLLYRAYFKIFLTFTDKNVFVCHHNLKTALRQKLVKSGTVIHNGISNIKEKILEPEKARQFLLNKIGVQHQDDFLIGSVGRLAYPKNYEFLINIFPKILKTKPNSCLLIIGEGKERKKYEALIKKLNLDKKIFLLGEIKNAYQWLRAFDLFVLPSEFEGLSLTLVEALSAQVPILAAQVGGNAEVLGYDSNQLYQLNNAKEFLEKFKTLALNKNKRQQAIEHNLKQIKKFNLEKMIKNYINLIQAET